MSPEYRVEIVIPHTFTVETEDEEKARDEALKAFEGYYGGAVCSNRRCHNVYRGAPF